MKKLVAILLAGAMALGCVACGNTNNNTTNTEDTQSTTQVEIENANEILAKVWTEYNAKASDDMKFPIAGGNMAMGVMDASADFDLTAEGAQDELVYSYCIPEETIAMIDDAATMMNMMMANNFTSAAYHVTDAANVETVVASIKDATMNNQWMCGFPETLIIATVGDSYVVTAFGNGQVIEAIKTAITTVYGDAAVVVVEESLAQ